MLQLFSKKKYFLKIIASLYLMFLFSSCSTDPNINIQVNAKINVIVSESISQTGRTVALTCATDSIYPCSNYGISSAMQSEGSTIVFRFYNITIPNSCFGNPGPATVQFNLGSLGNGNYDLQFLINDDVFQTTLTVSGNYFKFSNTASKWVSIKNQTTLRIPTNTIWGYIGFYEDTLKSQALAYLDSLKNLGAKSYNFLPGNYSLFQVDSTGDLIIPPNTTYKNTIPYIFVYGGDLNLARSLVKYFGKNSHINVSLLSDKGDVFYSWVLATEP